MLDFVGAHVAYIGGSWTRRAPAASPCDATVPLVTDLSPPKDDVDSNAYEKAKTRAHDVARQLSNELKIHVTFYDWASIVPNLAPNFTIAKMTAAALHDGKISYSEGDYGRPLLHAVDAGWALVKLTESRLRSQPSDKEYFDTIVMPGTFLCFQRFASIVAAVVEASGKRTTVELQRQDGAPSFLRTRCTSTRLAELEFAPSHERSEDGLRETCRFWLKKLSDAK